MTDHVEEMAEEKRAHFRVEDVLPVGVRKVEGACTCLKARMVRGFFPGCGVPTFEEGREEQESLPPALRKLLLQLDAKLNLVLEKLYLSGEEMLRVDNQSVSLSAAGIRLCTDAGFAVGDMAEIKLLVLSEGAAWLVLYGKVIRVAEARCGGQDTAIAFLEMEDEVRETLIRYTLRRQRELIRKQRGYVD
jgi:hypothetical protein